MNLAKLAVRRPVTITMLLLVIMMFGGVSLFGLPMDLMTKIDFPIAIVSTSYSGAGPREVESLVTEVLERGLGTVSGVTDLQSISSFERSLIVVTFEENVNIDQGALDIRERIDMLKPLLPDDAGTPTVMKIDINAMSNTQIAITSEHMDIVELKRLVEDEIAPIYERLEGVASVGIAGGREQEVQVEILPDKMRGYGVTETQIIALLRAENVSSPVGTLKQGDYRLQLRAIGDFESTDDLKRLPITTPSGQTIQLSDIANVSTVYKSLSSYAYVDSVPSIILTLQKTSAANTVDVSNLVIAENALVSANYPELKASIVMDPAQSIRTSISNVAEALIIGFSAAVIILFFFLRNLKSTFIVGVAIPVSVVGTFAMMYFGNITLNMISLMGLTLGVGTLVDNSIVVLECIYRRFEQGEDRKEAAVNGAKEVGMAVVAGTMTSIAVFLPIVFMGGLIANIFRDLSLTITFSHAVSLLVALTFVPMVCSIVLRRRDPNKKKRLWTRLMDALGRATGKLETAYRALLRGALRLRKTVLLLVAAYFVGTIYIASGIGSEFMSSMDMSAISVNISMPKGTLIDKTNETTLHAAEAIEDIPEIRDMVILTGNGGIMSLAGSSSDSANIQVNLIPKLERSRSAEEIAAEMKQKLSKIPGATITAEPRSMNAMVSNSLQFQLRGDDLDMMGTISAELAERIEKLPGVLDSKTSMEESTPEANIKIDRAKAAAYGISSSTVSTVLNTAVSGVVPTYLKIGGTELDIRVRQSQSTIEYLNDIEHILIPTPSGGYIPLSEIATVTVEQSPVSIERMNQERFIEVTTTYSGRALDDLQNEVTALIDAYGLPPGYYCYFGGAAEQMMEAFSVLGLALVMAIILIYMIVSSQFESLIHPFLIMLSVPASMTGGIVGLIWSGQTLNITSIIGLIMLSGIVVNNSILLIDCTNNKRREGMSIYDALLYAGPTRLRPILMSTLTSVLGMLPMIINNGAGAEMMKPMAVVVATGLVLGTLVTLVLIPVLYHMIDTGRERRRLKRKAKREAALVALAAGGSVQ